MVQPAVAVDRPSVRVSSELEVDGYERLRGFLSGDDVEHLAQLFDTLPSGRPGSRIPTKAVSSLPPIRRLTDRLRPLMGDAVRPVRTLFFDKRDGGNWALAWHQDRVIEVEERHDTAGFERWTIKNGRHHVSPPVSILSVMRTARLHLDDVDSDNAPLRIVPGSHDIGLIAESQIASIVAAGPILDCLADKGDVWLYATPILHASDRAVSGKRRRVIQIDYAAAALPGKLDWANNGSTG